MYLGVHCDEVKDAEKVLMSVSFGINISTPHLPILDGGRWMVVSSSERGGGVE